MARPRTNLPWIEKRRCQYRAYWRLPTGRDYLPFPTREDAEKFRSLAGLVGLDHAIAIATDKSQPDPEPTTAASGTPAVVIVTEPVRAGQPTGVTFDRVAETFFDNLTGVDEKTVAGYRSQVKHYLTPFFGGYDIGLILAKERARTPAEPYVTVTGWVSWMEQQYTYTNRGNQTDKHPSPKTIRNVHGLLYSILEQEVSDGDGVLLRNPCKSTKLPGDEPTERIFLEWRQVRRLLDALPERWRPLLLFLVLTGVRFGEAAGLTVGHVHLDPPNRGVPYVDIVRAMRWTKKGRVLGRLKTTSSRRRLYLPAGLVAALRPLVEGKPIDAVVFTSTEGGFLHHSNFTNRVLKRAIAKARLVDPTIPEATRVHAFRHTHAALLMSAGHSTRVVKERLGHASITTTDAVYGHLTEDATVATVATLDDLMAQAVFDPVTELAVENAERIDLPDPLGEHLPDVDFDDAEDLAA